MKKLLLTIAILLPVTAYADDVVTVDKLCRELPNYQPSADVTYTPNKDVHGRDVAPADLDGGSNQIGLGESIKLAITYDQAQQLHLPNVPYTPQMYIGNAEIKKDGSVFFNGKRLSQAQTQFLCDPKVNPNPNSSGQTPPQPSPASR